MADWTDPRPVSQSDHDYMNSKVEQMYRGRKGPDVKWNTLIVQDACDNVIDAFFDVWPVSNTKSIEDRLIDSMTNAGIPANDGAALKSTFEVVFLFLRDGNPEAE